MGSEKRKNSMGTFKRIFSYFRKITAYLLLGGFLFLLLSGSINQVKTGQNIIDYILSIGKKIGAWLEILPTNEGPIEINENGIYLKDKAKDVPKEGLFEEVKDNEDEN